MTSSVALCTYNGQNYIAHQLESILAQTQGVDEIIICDDGSIDNTTNIIESYRVKHPDIIKIYINPNRLGIIKNFEHAINLCTKDVIFLCDQDDIWHEDKVIRTINFFKNNDDKDAVFHNLRLMLNGQIINQTLWDTVFFYEECRRPEKLNWFITYFNNVVTGAALAIRKPHKPIFIKTNNVKVKKGSLPFFLHDYLLALDYTRSNKLGILHECLVDYRLHKSQNSGLKIRRHSNLSPYGVFNNTSVSVKVWYINRRIRKLTPYTDLHVEISIALDRLREEKNSLYKQLDPFSECIPLLKYTANKIYSILDRYLNAILNKYNY
ncbi:glycosyltransferase [Spirosoma terrae]|uniref:Glycosyltransferase n=1 Tax=Spirosoma terrae TaxID=1968276 RepID=A0A6L9LAJ9_9BACT|nr:glycosyltransferase [Spirosoma terrae]NDU95833.1 glycosyltransferase [Spirosoma terrae]